MSAERSHWAAGRALWERMATWHVRPQSEGDGGEWALSALADIGQLRRLLDQTELSAVRTARTHGKSWAEIATQLGVTRQSAWERWRNLDETQADRQAEIHRDTLKETTSTVVFADDQLDLTVVGPT